MIILLNDLSEGTTDAVIVSKTSTAEDVQNAINNAKAENDNWDFLALVDSLPSDCKIYTKWDNMLQIAYY